MHPESLHRALERLRLEGAVFLRAEYTEGWALDSQGGPAFAGMLHPGARRVILLHVLASGRCWLSLTDGERHWASSGDVIVLPYGDEHTMGGVAPAASVPITALLTAPPWEQVPIIRHGQGGSRTQVVCGYLHSEDPLFDPRLRALPPVFVVRPAGPAARWVEANIAYALEASSGGRSELVSTRLPELLLVEVLRLHLATAPAVERGWVAALRDPVLGPAMALLHAAPERKWTVAALAAGAAVSRSVLDSRFRQDLNRSPADAAASSSDGSVYASVAEALQAAEVDVLVDYTSAAAARDNVWTAVQAGVHVVIGSSGLTAGDYEQLDRLARDRGVGVIASGNFSVMAAVLQRAAAMAVRQLDRWEIVDYADADKPDVPSGMRGGRPAPEARGVASDLARRPVRVDP